MVSRGGLHLPAHSLRLSELQLEISVGLDVLHHTVTASFIRFCLSLFTFLFRLLVVVDDFMVVFHLIEHVLAFDV